jgi:hypothetical protein
VCSVSFVKFTTVFLACDGMHSIRNPWKLERNALLHVQGVNQASSCVGFEALGGGYETFRLLECSAA